jgi:hypothetical protein
LCGKYAAPLLGHNQVLIGATQEFKDNPLDSTEVEAELVKKQSNAFTSDLWDGSSINKITQGFQVQSNQGPQEGRMPILGQFETPIHHKQGMGVYRSE